MGVKGKEERVIAGEQGKEGKGGLEKRGKGLRDDEGDFMEKK